MDRAEKIVLDNLAAARPAIHAREDTGIGGSIHNPIADRQRLEISRNANVAMEQLHARLAQRAAIGFAAGANEVVQADELPVRPPPPQAASQRAPHESANSCE